MNFELNHHPASAASADPVNLLNPSHSATTWPPFLEQAKDLPAELLLAFQKHRTSDVPDPISAGLDLDYDLMSTGPGSDDEPNWELLMEQYMKNASLLVGGGFHGGSGTTGGVPLAGSLEMSDDEQLFLTILYGAAIAIAVAGNLAVILVFLFGRRWNSDLSIFLVNLAFSDIVLSVFCMPFTMSQVVKHHWQFSDALCPIVLFLQLSSVIASVYTLVAIGVDRYLFVTRPLKARLTKRKGKMVIGFIWLFALTLSSVQVREKCDKRFSMKFYKNINFERKITFNKNLCLEKFAMLKNLIFSDKMNFHRIENIILRGKQF